jgi:hypothetical protein
MFNNSKGAAPNQNMSEFHHTLALFEGSGVCEKRAKKSCNLV